MDDWVRNDWRTVLIRTRRRYKMHFIYSAISYVNGKEEEEKRTPRSLQYFINQ